MDNGVDFIFARRAPPAVPPHHSYHAHARMRQQQFDGSSGVPLRPARSIVNLPDAAANKLGALNIHHVERVHRATDDRTRQRSPETRAQRDRSSARGPEPPALLASASSPPSVGERYEVSKASPTASSHDDSYAVRHRQQPVDALQPGSTPTQLRHGRKYLRNEAYPLPCDLQEIHRQNLKTMLTCTILGRAVCASKPLARPPLRVLEVGCGSAYWTLECHRMFSAMGHDDILYTGLDVVALAPDLRKQGVNWTFVRHDLRRCPWPFDDETFDLVMCKDMSVAIPLGIPTQQIMDECIRLLSIGGTLEIWESDHTVRCLQPHAPAIRSDHSEQQMAERTATYPMSPTTPFAPTPNKYLRSANVWIEQALGDRNLSSTPCSRVAPMILQEPECLADIGVRRIAVPLSPMSWDGDNRRTDDPDRRARSRSRVARPKKHLDAEQVAIREAALLLIVQTIESLEPLLRKASGKNTEEWSYWWTSMLTSLTEVDSSTPLNGECLEIGAWWATKIE